MKIMIYSSLVILCSLGAIGSFFNIMEGSLAENYAKAMFGYFTFSLNVLGVVISYHELKSNTH